MNRVLRTAPALALACLAASGAASAKRAPTVDALMEKMRAAYAKMGPTTMHVDLGPGPQSGPIRFQLAVRMNDGQHFVVEPESAQLPKLRIVANPGGITVYDAASKRFSRLPAASLPEVLALGLAELKGADGLKGIIQSEVAEVRFAKEKAYRIRWTFAIGDKPEASEDGDAPRLALNVFVRRSNALILGADLRLGGMDSPPQPNDKAAKAPANDASGDASDGWTTVASASVRYERQAALPPDAFTFTPPDGAVEGEVTIPDDFLEKFQPAGS